MRIEDLQPGDKRYAALDMKVLAVLSRRVDGWCIYIGAVPGGCHDEEWQSVAAGGTKLHEGVAKAMLWPYFGIDSTELEDAR